MQAREIRIRFLQFFEKRGHAIIPSASLVTPDLKGVTNPTLFNTAGMQPLIPFLLGKAHPLGKRLVDTQKCLRTVDIDDIGDKTHATFFEMLGNWSLGDYFKKDAILWSYEFLTSKHEGLNLDPNRLYITVFEGDNNAPRDEEAANIWKEIFIANGVNDPENRIFFMNATSNWWQAGDNGPCGPDSEMYYDIGNKFGGKGMTKEQFIAADSIRDVVEVWNDVFMQYEKMDGKIIGNLPAPSVDTGAGLERLAMTMQGVDNIFDTDLFLDIMNEVSKVASRLESKRIISDHMRASVFLIADGVTPANTDRGYILRRLIRRAVFNTDSKKMEHSSVENIVNAVAFTYKGAYDYIEEKSAYIAKVISEEAAKFERTLEQGTKEFEKISAKSEGSISGFDAFTLFSSYGLPIDLTLGLAKEKGLSVNIPEFETEFIKHQELSRSGAEKKFKGGLADTADPMIIRYHTATHILHQALFDVLGNGIMQKGSNITGERLRFDFAHGAKMTDQEKIKVESIVNEKINAEIPVNKVIMSKDEALKTKARHFFGEKYGDEISIYFIGQTLAEAYSAEFCGGPHVSNTKELAGPDGKWKFKIAKEEAVAQGIRRIKAILS